MKVAKEGGTNKQRQTQTNTLETKTNRIKSWFTYNLRAPAITALVAGFLLLAYSVPALTQGSYQPLHESSELDGLPDETADPPDDGAARQFRTGGSAGRIST